LKSFGSDHKINPVKKFVLCEPFNFSYSNDNHDNARTVSSMY
jgi:hypothetical protein